MNIARRINVVFRIRRVFILHCVHRLYDVCNKSNKLKHLLFKTAKFRGSYLCTACTDKRPRINIVFVFRKRVYYCPSLIAR